MITGLEPAVAKLAAAGAAKALGWGSTAVGGRLADRQMKKRLEAPIPEAERVETFGGLDDAEASKLAEFVASAEVEQLAYGIAAERLLKMCGKGSELRLAELQNQFTQTLRLYLDISEERAEGPASIIFEMTDEAVISTVGEYVGPGGDMPPGARASLVKCATSTASASVRNTELLRGIVDLQNYRESEARLQTSVANLHATMKLPHAGTTRQVPYERLFVQPTVLARKGESDQPKNRESTFSLVEFLSLSPRTVLLGDPGGGKSTSSLKLAYDLASGRLGDLKQKVPFLVILRDYAELFADRRLSITDFLARLCETPYGVRMPDGAIEYLLLNGRALVIFDGLDELLDTSLRRDVVLAVEGFTHQYPLATMLVTSRRVGYDEAALDADLYKVAELQQFSDEQVEAYARRWFSLDESIAGERKNQVAAAFLGDSKFVGDLRVNPLMLSLMCGIYASENYIPRNRPDVYEKCALLLFDRWDKQRGINAPLAFDAHVQAAMRSLALWLYPRQESQQGLPREQLVDYMKRYLLDKRFDDENEAEQAAVDFIDFCKGRAWVLTDVGAELYGFTHRTFLEYFAASQLVRLHPNSSTLLSELSPRIQRAEWDVISQLALQILGKTVEDGADDFLEEMLAAAAEMPEESRANVLSFACRSLEFIVPRPAVLRRIVEQSVAFHCENRPTDASSPPLTESRPVSSVFSVSNENLPLTGRYLSEVIQQRLERNVYDERALVLGMFPLLFARWSGRSDSRSGAFWKGWEREFLTQAKAPIRTQAERFAWVAQAEVQRGTLGVVEFVRRFGMRALYDFDMAGETLVPPLAYVIIHGAQGMDIYMDQLSGSVVRDLHAYVAAAPAPWINRDPHYKSISYLGSYAKKSPGEGESVLLSLAFMLSTPIWELGARGKAGSNGGYRHRLIGEFGARRRPQPGRKRRSYPLSALQLTAPARRFAESWLDGSSSYVDPKPSGSTVPRPLT
jgi:hypothetical protein